ncbi:MAG: hypothetical protein HY556_07300 [Euryarchaeota archaeon]|nr:hypothetical protein [Euryarchaeota archaeon]
MLNLAYSPMVPTFMIDAMEWHGRRLGVPLSVLETLGQDENTVKGFLDACEVGRGYDYINATILNDLTKAGILFPKRSERADDAAKAH